MNKKVDKEEQHCLDMREYTFLEGFILALDLSIETLEKNRAHFQKKVFPLRERIKAYKCNNNHKCKGKKNAKPIRKSVLK